MPFRQITVANQAFYANYLPVIQLYFVVMS